MFKFLIKLLKCYIIYVYINILQHFFILFTKYPIKIESFCFSRTTLCVYVYDRWIFLNSWYIKISSFFVENNLFSIFNAVDSTILVINFNYLCILKMFRSSLIQNTMLNVFHFFVKECVSINIIHNTRREWTQLYWPLSASLFLRICTPSIAHIASSQLLNSFFIINIYYNINYIVYKGWNKIGND